MPSALPRKVGKSCGIMSGREIEQKHMATLIPAISTCVSRMTPGERRTAERLEQKLDADYLLWYDVPMGPRNTHPDFVVLHPRRGILILEAALVDGSGFAQALRATHPHHLTKVLHP